MIVAALLASLAVQQSTRPQDRATALDSAHAAADSFVQVWRFYWESSELIRSRRVPGGHDIILDRRGEGGIANARAAAAYMAPVAIPLADSIAIAISYQSAVVPSSLREALLHCHPDGFQGRGRPEPYIIESGAGRRAVCPSWYPRSMPPPWDERLGIDNAIAPQLRPPVRAARTALLDQLDRAAQTSGYSDWLIGQRVRFALDNGDTSRAVKSLASCGANRWWCAMLRGYVAASRGYMVAADSMFMTGLASMPPAEHCYWNDASVLIGGDGADQYRKLECYQRDSVNAVMWWLSDPSWAEPGNDRRAEHYARLVLYELRFGTKYHERLDMVNDGGGRAVKDMVTRYGWPSFSAWGGPLDDAGHYRYLDLDETYVGHGRFITQEYSADRVHTVPSWSAISHPLTADALDWNLTRRAGSIVDPADTTWWPVEHYDRTAEQLIQLWTQTAMFRRERRVLFAVSTDLTESDSVGAIGDTLKGAVLFTTQPDLALAQPHATVVGQNTAFQSLIASAPSVFGLELRGTRAHAPLARTRFGIAPPPTLSSMRIGEIAVSEPALLHAGDEADLPVNNPDLALPLMLGTTTFAEVKRIGVYWETYGVSPTDSVDISVRVLRHEPEPGVLRRIGYRLGLGQRTDGGISVNWGQSPGANRVWNLAGRIPVQGRQLIMDLSQLAPGDYSIVARVTKSGVTTVSPPRDFKVLGKK